jgi:hypothetical protein
MICAHQKVNFPFLNSVNNEDLFTCPLIFPKSRSPSYDSRLVQNKIASKYAVLFTYYLHTILKKLL